MSEKKLPKYPNVKIKVNFDPDGDNSLGVVEDVLKEMKLQGIDQNERNIFYRKCFACKSYKDLLEYMESWVTVQHRTNIPNKSSKNRAWN